jgi:hypothetical protein
MADPTLPPPPPGFTLDAPPASPVVPIIPRTPAPQTPAQASKDVSDAQSAAEVAAQNKYKVTQEQLATKKQEAQRDMSTEGLNQLISSVEKAKGLVNNWSTGFGHSALKDMPDTDARALNGVVTQEIRGNIFLNRINQMKEENGSPNGGTGIGRIMQAEIPMMTGALGNLDLGNKPQMVTDNLNQIEYRALRSKAILDGKDPDDPAVQKQYGIDKIAALLPGPATNAGNSGDGTSTPPPGVSSLSPDQQKAYDAFLRANPNPTGDQVGTFLSHLTGRTVTNGDEIAKAITQGRGVNDTVNNTTEQQKVASTIASEDKAGIDQDDPAHRILVHGATLGLSDEAAGIGNAAANVISSPFTGNFDPVGSYELGRDVERQRVADAEQKLGRASVPLEFIGGLASGNPESAIAKAAVQPTVAQVVRQGAKAGGAYGVISGYGNGQGLQNSLVGAGVGGATGATIGAVGGRILAGRTPPPAPPGGASASDVSEALAAEGIPAARPVADPSVRGKMAYLETTPGGHSVVQNSLAQTRQSIADKVAGLGGSGEALTPGGMGEAIQNAGTGAINNMKAQAGRFYDRAATAGAGEAISPTNALAELDSNIAELQRNPNNNQGLISYLQDVRNDLAQPGRTVADIRDLRTGLSGEINRRNLGMSNADRIMGNVLDAAGTDISRDLGKSNPEALSLYNQGDALWRQMSQERDQVLSKLVGSNPQNPISGEAAMSRVVQMMGNKGDLARFNRVMDMMGPEDQANFRATLWDNIGRRSPDEPFSPGVFVQQTRNMQDSALERVFGQDGAQSIRNLRVASKAFSDAQSSLNNSRTGLAINMKNAVGMLLNLKNVGMGGAGYAVGGVPGMMAGAAAGPALEQLANRLSAKALMNPEVSQWVRKVATAKTNQQAQILLGKLSTLGAGNASLQPEISGFRDMISKALNDNVTPAAAASGSGNSQNNKN